MTRRSLYKELLHWKNSSNRKPLILRGARQVGKTTLVHQFSEEFEQYIYLNLEKIEDKKIIENYDTLTNLMNKICFEKNLASYHKKETLLFIDEIQEYPELLNELRYFLEELPNLYVIAAGSLLEMVLNQKIKYPVGRVSFMIVKPYTFIEFLRSIDEHKAIEIANVIPLPEYAKEKILKLFHIYALIGGMPEIVEEYKRTKDVLSLTNTYESLIMAYIDDVEKYAKNKTQNNILRHIIRTFLKFASERITFGNFAESSYGSREVGEAMRTIEKTHLLNLVYPTTNTNLPILPNLKKKPRLQILDTGLLNYFSKIQHLIVGSNNLTSVFNGKVIEHLVGQELYGLEYYPLFKLAFWVRDKAGSSAEMDYVYDYKGKLIPIEVKSGKSGTLKSLHVYMQKTTHKMAIRFYNGDLKIDHIDTKEANYYLLSLPYFLVFKIKEYLHWFEKEVNETDRDPTYAC